MTVIGHSQISLLFKYAWLPIPGKYEILHENFPCKMSMAPVIIKNIALNSIKMAT